MRTMAKTVLATAVASMLGAGALQGVALADEDNSGSGGYGGSGGDSSQQQSQQSDGSSGGAIAQSEDGKQYGSPYDQGGTDSYGGSRGYGEYGRSSGGLGDSAGGLGGLLGG